MHSIEKTDYGIKLVFGGRVDAEEIKVWLAEFKLVVDEQVSDFQVFVDMRTLIPLMAECRQPLEDGQIYANRKGMNRSVVILSNPVLTLQFKGIAHETGIYKYERYVDASSDPDWEQTGLAWLTKCIDPKLREKVTCT